MSCRVGSDKTTSVGLLNHQVISLDTGLPWFSAYMIRIPVSASEMTETGFAVDGLSSFIPPPVAPSSSELALVTICDRG